MKLFRKLFNKMCDRHARELTTIGLDPGLGHEAAGRRQGGLYA